MSNYNKVICPFCNKQIPYIYDTIYIHNKKKRRRKPKKQKIVVGIDFEGHKNNCSQYREFINKNK